MISVRQTQRVCVKVAQQTLTLYVRVRILLPLPDGASRSLAPFFFSPLLPADRILDCEGQPSLTTLELGVLDLCVVPATAAAAPAPGAPGALPVFPWAPASPWPLCPGRTPPSARYISPFPPFSGKTTRRRTPPVAAAAAAATAAPGTAAAAADSPPPLAGRLLTPKTRPAVKLRGVFLSVFGHLHGSYI